MPCLVEWFQPILPTSPLFYLKNPSFSHVEFWEKLHMFRVTNIHLCKISFKKTKTLLLLVGSGFLFLCFAFQLTFTFVPLLFITSLPQVINSKISNRTCHQINLQILHQIHHHQQQVIL